MPHVGWTGGQVRHAGKSIKRNNLELLEHSIASLQPLSTIMKDKTMKHLFIVVTLLAFSGYSFSQIKCDIENYYDEFIKTQKFKYNDEEYLVKKVVETKNTECFSNLVNSNIMYIDYLLTNFSSNSNYRDLLSITDSLTLQKNYIKQLQEDSLFNSVMSDLVAKTIEKKLPKDTISMDELLNIAVKYFTILRINEDGYYVGKVCVGLNSIEKTEAIRQPHIEAFSFSSILKHYQSEKFSMYDEFVKAIKELYKVNFGIDKEERLLRAQGAMFLLMRNNVNLGKMLKSEYEKNIHNLPFVLTDK